MGVVTLRGGRHVARVGASLLTTLELTELIAGDEDEFVSIAAALAKDTQRLDTLIRGLRGQMRAMPL